MEKLINEILDSPTYREIIEKHPEANVRSIYDLSIKNNINAFDHYWVFLQIPDGIIIEYRNIDILHSSLKFCRENKLINEKEFWLKEQLMFDKVNKTLNILETDRPFK